MEDNQTDMAEEMRPGQDIALNSGITQYNWTWDILRNRDVPVYRSTTPVPFDLDMEIVDYENRDLFGEYSIPEHGKYARWKGPDMLDGREICVRRWQVYEILAEQNMRSILVLDGFKLFGWVGPEYLEFVADANPVNYTRH